MQLALGFALGTVFWIGSLGACVYVALHEGSDTDEFDDY